MAKNFDQIVERLKTLGAPGVLVAFDPEQASKADPLALLCLLGAAGWELYVVPLLGGGT